jgi:hypothetical protein
MPMPPGACPFLQLPPLNATHECHAYYLSLLLQGAKGASHFIVNGSSYGQICLLLGEIFVHRTTISSLESPHAKKIDKLVYVR